MALTKYSGTALTIFIAVWCIFLSTTSRGDCLSYQGEIKLRGRIIKRVFPGPPQFESVKTGDRPERALVLLLARPVCVDASKDQPDDMAEKGVSIIQLWTSFDEFDDIRRRSNKRYFTVTGRLFHRYTGHHHTRVLMTVNQIE